MVINDSQSLWVNFPRANPHLLGDGVRLLGGVLELADDGVQLVCLVLDRLHLLSDGVHLDLLLLKRLSGTSFTIPSSP